jgi:hypothetical protein
MYVGNPHVYQLDAEEGRDDAAKSVDQKILSQ